MLSNVSLQVATSFRQPACIVTGSPTEMVKGIGRNNVTVEGDTENCLTSILKSAFRDKGGVDPVRVCKRVFGLRTFQYLI